MWVQHVLNIDYHIIDNPGVIFSHMPSRHCHSAARGLCMVNLLSKAFVPLQVLVQCGCFAHRIECSSMHMNTHSHTHTHCRMMIGRLTDMLTAIGSFRIHHSSPFHFPVRMNGPILRYTKERRRWILYFYVVCFDPMCTFSAPHNCTSHWRNFHAASVAEGVCLVLEFTKHPN